MEIGLGIDPDGVGRGGGDVDGDAVVEEAKLFEPLDLFHPGERQGGEAFQSGAAVGVDAEVLAVAGESDAVAIKGDGGAGEIKSAAVGGGDDLDGVRIGNIFGRTGDGKGSDLDIGVAEEVQQRREVRGGEQGFVALDVEVDIGADRLGDGMDPVGATGAVGRSKDSGDAARLAEVEDLVGIRGDEDAVEEGAGACGPIDPGNHGLACDFAEDFAGKASGSEASGNDGEDVTEVGGQGGSPELV